MTEGAVPGLVPVPSLMEVSWASWWNTGEVGCPLENPVKSTGLNHSALPSGEDVWRKRLPC